MRFFLAIASIIILSITLPDICSAQNIFSQGYYVGSSGNSIAGLIRVSKYTNKIQVIEFKKNENASPQMLSPENVDVIVISGKRKFTSERMPNHDYDAKKYFFDELISGTISLYYFPDLDNKNHLYIKKEEKLILISNKSVVIQPYLFTYEIDNRFRRALNYYLNDCDKIQTTINSTRYTVNSMVKLIKKYHECLNLDYHIENEEDLKQIIRIGVTALVNSSNLTFTSFSDSGDSYIENNFNSNLYTSIGFFLKFSSNKVSPRLSVSIEPTYFQFTYADKTNDDKKTQRYQNIQFPFIIAYNLLGKNKNSLPIEIGTSLTSIINNPQFGTSSNLNIKGIIDVIAGLRYELMFQNSKSLGFIVRYYYGVSGINSTYRYSGKRHRFGVGLSYDLFKN